MEELKYIRTSSKKALLDSSLFIAKGDFEKANNIYEFYASKFDNLPDFDIVPPTTMTQVKDFANSAFTFMNENQNTILEWAGILKGLVAKNSSVINNSEPLPKI